ncbi:hypothetical protein BGZ74_009721 [Mortierella antarctica]|nr:hypothetical protein BGZ74_009721 [Mortierella antarctica]
MSSHPSISGRELALTIPHIREYIIHHLAAKDIRRCTRVSWEFHHLFAPYLWRFLSISRRYCFNSLRDRISAYDERTLAERQSKIHTLSSIYGETWDLFLERIDTSSHILDPTTRLYALRAPFSNLTVLRALSTPKVVGVSYNNCVYVPQFLTLIEHSLRLHELEMSYIGPGHSTQIARLAEIIRGHPSLKKFKLSTQYILCHLYRKLLWGCWNMDRVDLTMLVYVGYKNGQADEICHSADDEKEFDTWFSQHRMPHRDTSESDIKGKGKKELDPVLPEFKVKELYLYSRQSSHETGATFPFLRRCPHLERLRLPQVWNQTVLTEFARMVPISLPKLAHLDLQSLDGSRQPNDANEAALFAACSHHGGLRSVAMSHTHVALPETMDALVRLHGASLESLDLVGCYKVSSTHVQQLLTHCASLRSFVAVCETLIRPEPLWWTSRPTKADPSLQPHDVEYAEDWACLGLRTLRLQFSCGDVSTVERQASRAGIPRAIQRQIGRLEKLQDLRLCRDVSAGRGFKDLSETSFDEIENWEKATLARGKENMEDALAIFSCLHELETLELRHLKEFVNPLSVRLVRKEWSKIRWVHYN